MANRYRVVWQIDIDADSPKAAAELALVIQRDPNSIATLFEVSEEDGINLVLIDLSDEE